jgi:hypothetical protein
MSLFTSKMKTFYDKLVLEVLEMLANNDLVILTREMCQGRKRSGIPWYILTLQGMMMAEDKTKVIQEWQTPKSLMDVQSFLEFANFYQYFILGFSKICHPLTASTKEIRKTGNGLQI